MILTQLLFPVRCPVCDRPVKPFGGLICTGCEPKLVRIREPRCMKCGKQLDRSEKEYCHDCQRGTHRYDKGTALYVYGSVRKCLYRLKYGGRQEYAVYLGRQMAVWLGPEIRTWKPDALVAVPLHASRFRRRGYNQALLLARQMGMELGIPVLEKYAVRTRCTKPQKELAGHERQINLKKAFKIIENDVKLDTIVIIDDIYTTGSTIDALAAECRKAGVKHVFYAALSIGNGL